VILSPRKVFVRGSLELGFSSVRHNANLTQGSTFKAHVSGDCGHRGRVGVGHTHLWSLWNSVMSPGCDFVPLDQIVIVSLNGFRRQVATCHNTQTVPRIDETLVLLDSWHQIPARGTPLL
jgi:hypothetical protein